MVKSIQWTDPMRNALFGSMNGLFNKGNNPASPGETTGLRLSPLGASPWRNNAAQGQPGLLSLLPLRDNALTKSPKEESADAKKGDRVELSQFAEDAAKEALENAKKSPANGTTSQILVSQDGRFAASIDLKINQDGSYDMELAVRFAASDAAKALLGTGMVSPDGTGNPQETQRASLQATQTVQRYTSYEHTLETRGFQARIFYEEAKGISQRVEQAYGGEAGAAYMNVAQQVSHEFSLNISISGDDIHAFNEVAANLTQFDESGTLSGFLQAAQGVLTADSRNLGAFVNATQALVSSAQEHVGSRMNQFFTGMNEQYGAVLEKMGFGSDSLAIMGQDVQANLNTFFQLTNDLLANMFGEIGMNPAQNPTIEQAESMRARLEEIREQQQEKPEKKEDWLERYRQPVIPPESQRGILA